MKNLSILFKLQLLAIFVLSVGVGSSFAQQVKQDTRYVSTKYKFAFQAPKDSSKQSVSTEESVVFLGNQPNFERGSGVNLAVIEEENAAIISRNLLRDESLETFVSGMIEGFQENADNKISVIDKKRVRIAGLTSVRVSALVSFTNRPELKMRLVSFAIPVPQHKRMYVFTVTGVEKDFAKWLPVAEASVNTFALIRAAPVKP